MTPGARVAAAIDILDQIGDGLAAEQALTRWARASRFAGSGDRAAVRDHVYDVMRTRRSCAWLGGAETGRGLMIGLLRQQEQDIGTLFNAQGHAPAPLLPHEEHLPGTDMPRAVAWNLPDWIMPIFERSLGAEAAEAAQALQSRAPVTVRVNLAKVDRNAARKSLADDGVECVINPLSTSALTVTEGQRKLRNAQTFQRGEVEIQDAASQSVVEELPDATRILDYCAGGGGKALALAMRKGTEIFAHDIAPQRMADIPQRAARAGAVITCLKTEELGSRAPFDLVLCDAPCSGSGAWRRGAEAKWTLTPERLNELTGIQDGILDVASGLTALDGTLAYVTCSVLREENEDRVRAFMDRAPGWHCKTMRRYPITTDGDGFFAAHLTRAK